MINAAVKSNTGLRIKAHDACIYKNELTQSINGKNYRCDCGRVSNWQDIAYISSPDAEGNATVEYCRNYTRVSAGDSICLAGWNVLSQTLGGQTMTLAAGSGAQLILCNGDSFAAGTLELNDSLTIYAQSLKAGEMGALTAKITQSAGAPTIAGGTVTLSEGSSFVKLVAENNAALVDTLPEECAYKAKNGGKIARSALGSELENVEVVACTEHGYAYGVCQYCGDGVRRASGQRFAPFYRSGMCGQPNLQWHGANTCHGGQPERHMRHAYLTVTGIGNYTGTQNAD